MPNRVNEDFQLELKVILFVFRYLENCTIQINENDLHLFLAFMDLPEFSHNVREGFRNPKELRSDLNTEIWFVAAYTKVGELFRLE